MVSEAFRGEFYQKVDSKARVSIPAAFRRILEAEDPASGDSRPRVYMVYGGKNRNFVECYSRSGADALAARIDAMELGSVDRDRAERESVSYTHLDVYKRQHMSSADVLNLKERRPLRCAPLSEKRSDYPTNEKIRAKWGLAAGKLC